MQTLHGMRQVEVDREVIVLHVEHMVQHGEILLVIGNLEKKNISLFTWLNWLNPYYENNQHL